MGLGIRNIDYSQLSEESLVYLFLHDEPSLTKKEVSELNNSICTIFLIFFVT
ncbi:Phage integrase [Bacillus cereus BDRD-ST26]|nr:Phage integrase [Bacillus cereus BDRD-ST26]